MEFYLQTTYKYLLRTKIQKKSNNHNTEKETMEKLGKISREELKEIIAMEDTSNRST